MRTITAPGVEWKEIDRSGYSPAMTGTTCYVPGFTTKGEPYKPMEFTSKAAWISYYGEPDNEAERYSYAAACETIDQNGRLYFARLPYDNAAFEKMPAVKYKLTIRDDYSELAPDGIFEKIQLLDDEIKDAAIIEGGSTPITYDLSAIDEFRTDENKVPANTFLIVDTTGSTYSKVTEDTRKGHNREVIGIIPVVTTAANAMYAQQLITLNESEKHQVSSFEVINSDSLLSLKATDAEGNTLVIGKDTMENGGLLNTDFAKLLNTNGYYTMVENGLSSVVKSKAFLRTTSIDEVKTDFMSWAENYTEPGIVSVEPILSTLVSSDFEVDETSTTLTSTWNNEHDGTDTTIDETYVKWQGLVNITYKLDEDDPKYGWHNLNGDDAIPDTLALDANGYFSTIQPAADGNGIDPEHLKDIGVVVYKAYLDPSEGNKVSYEAVEAYCGSLYKDDKDPNTRVTKFIDTIINSQSKYINFFSNCFASKASKEWYLKNCDILIAKPSQGAVLGLYSAMTKEDISISKSIYDGLNKSFAKVSDINERDIDIVCDTGISNIASYLKAIFGDKGPYDLSITDDLGNSMLGMWKAEDPTNAAVKTWKTVVQKFDTFCKKTRKDCMFIADGLRPLVLQGQKKIIRSSKPANTIDANILPYLKTVTGINSSYVAEYIDWFEQADDYTGDFFWCPPSIKAMGVYINTDVNFNYWDAPAGLNRGMVACTDIAFSPTPKQAGAIYEKCLNYAINYPADGIVLEGQKTTQVKPSAFDRVNVRRLFCRLERASYKVARYFVYEGNTAYTRQRLVDALDPYFKEAKVGGGVYDYKIICDESINDPTTIDRNELKVKIGIKPTKTAEFIMIDFIAVSTGGSFSEAMS